MTPEEIDIHRLKELELLERLTIAIETISDRGTKLVRREIIKRY